MLISGSAPALLHSYTPSPLDVLAQPVEVAFVARGDRQGDELGRVVGMLFDNELLQRLEFYLGGFENDQYLCARLDLSLPPVVRFYFGNEVGAGDEAGAHGGFGKTTSRCYVWRRDQNGRKTAASFHGIRLNGLRDKTDDVRF